MKTIVRHLGNIGPFDEIEVQEDRLRCLKGAEAQDYPFVVIGDYTISENPADAPVVVMPRVVPESVSMKQARKALILGNISISSVDAAIEAIADPIERELAQTDWEYSATVERNSPLVASLSSALGLTSQQVDDLFVAASAL